VRLISGSFIAAVSLGDIGAGPEARVPALQKASGAGQTMRAARPVRRNNEPSPGPASGGAWSAS
jgi:hypothetical protein